MLIYNILFLIPFIGVILNINQNRNHALKYTTSDSEHFNKIMNLNSSKSSLTKKKEKTKSNNYYNSLDIKNFDKLNQFTIFYNNKTLNKKSEITKDKNNYTANDVNLFDKIFKFKDDIKNVNKKKINSKIDIKKIKIIDFEELNKREKNFKNKVGIEKIKIVYFD